jgi:hypothetical protein
MSEILPLIPSLAQYEFDTTLDGNPFTINIRWNMREEKWYMDLWYTDGTVIATGLALVVGAIIGLRIAHADFPGLFLVRDTAAPKGSVGRDAGFDDMGQRVQVYLFRYDEVIPVD